MQKQVVSVIIPMYNAQKTIKQCIESVLTQSYSNIEIIIINDGSSDDSYSVCMDYAQCYDNIKLLNCQNMGVSKARNIGLQNASGHYIQFLDSDDVLYETTIADKVNALSKYRNTEMVITDFDFIYPNGRKEKNPKLVNNTCMKIEEYIADFSEKPTSLFFGVLWNKIFIKSIIANNNIQFEENISFAEDFRFILEYLKYVNNIVYISKSEYGYLYATNIDSLSKNRDLCKHLWEERKNLYKVYKELYEYKAINSNKISNYIFESIGNVVESYIKYFGYRDTVKEIKKICKDSIVKNLKENSLSLRKSFKILLICIKYRLNFLIYVMYYLHAKLNLKS